MSDLSQYIAYFKGEWVPYSQVKIDLDDRGFLHSDLTFDVARTFNGEPFRLKDHLDRLYRGLKYLRIDPGLSPQQMSGIIREVVRRNEPHRASVGDFTIYTFVTRGRGHSIRNAGSPTVGVYLNPVNFAGFARFYLQGVHGVIARTRSYPNECLDAKLKHRSRLNFVLAELEVADVDPEAWPILLDLDGNVTEGTGHNVFLVKDGILKTPTDRSILQGVSRAVVMELARQLKIPVVEDDLQPYDLYTADEVFFTRTSPRIVPVSRVDFRPIGDKVPGPVTKRLLAAHSELVGLDIVDQALRYAKLKE